MPRPFSSAGFFRDPFFQAAGTLGGVACVLVVTETEGLMKAGQLIDRPGRWARCSVRKSEIASRPSPHALVVIDSVTWRVDGEPTDSGDVWEFNIVTDQRKNA